MAKSNRTLVYFDRHSSTFQNLTPELIQELCDCFPGINVELELKRLVLWLKSPRGIFRIGDLNLILYWLKNADKSPQIEVTERSPIHDHLGDYLSDLWQGKEKIFQKNSTRPYPS